MARRKSVKSEMTENVESATEEEVISVADVVPVQGVGAQWRIVAVGAATYYTGSEIIAELARRAKNERKRVKVQVKGDSMGRSQIESMVVLEEAAGDADEAVESEREGFLF
ncbi:MAG TPA: hypothetical protein VGP72_02930 [Planctomycetota bacterium]|jgi:hypothetical protein